MTEFWELLMNTDEYLLQLASQNARTAYLFLFLIIFAESGNPVFAFFPGDGLLLAVGVVAGTGVLDIKILFLLLTFAAISGYILNYFTGLYFGKEILSGNYWLKKEHLDKTQVFFKKHGAKTLIVGRFFPIVRTFAPFLAGMSKMKYQSFVIDAIIGAIAWIGFFLMLGYWVSNIPWVKENFFVIYVGMHILILVPLAIAGLQFLIKKRQLTF